MNDREKSHTARVEANTLKNQARISRLESTIKNLSKKVDKVQSTAERFARIAFTHGGE